MNNHREMPEVAWFPIQCRTRQEDRTGEHLAHQGLESINPSSRVEKLHAGKVKQQEQPMFPGNLFARIRTQDYWTALHATRDISRVVSFCGQLTPIGNSVFAGMRERTVGTCSSWQAPEVQVDTHAELDAVGKARVRTLRNSLNTGESVYQS